MRLLYLVNAPRDRATGAAIRALAMSRALTSQGEHVAIAGPPDSALERGARAAGISFYPVVFRPTPRDLLRLGRAVREEGPDVIHAMSAFPLVLAVPHLLLGRLGSETRALFVSVLVEPGSALVYADGRRRPIMTRLRNGLLRRTAPIVDGVFPVSRSVQEGLESIGVRGRMSVTGADLDIEDLARRAEAPFPLPEGGPRIGTAIGQLEPLKGVDHLLRAFSRVVGSHPDAVCLIAGEGSQRGELKRLARSLGIADRVHLLGYLDDPAPFMAALDVYVSPSLSEGLGTATAEALALGVPVVSTDVGGVRDVVSDGESGLLVPPGDATALADALERMLDDPALAGRLADFGAADARERFGTGRAIDVQVMEYRRALARRSPRSGENVAGRPESS